MSKKKQYQNGGKYTPKNAVKKSVMSEKKKNILAYVLAFFMIFWTACSVLGTIGFVKSSAEDETITIPRNYVRSDNSYGVMLDGFNGAFWYDNNYENMKTCNDIFFLEMNNQADTLTINDLVINYDTIRNGNYFFTTSVFILAYDEGYNENFRLNINTTHYNWYSAAPVAIEYEKRVDNSLACYIMFADDSYLDIHLTGLSNAVYQVGSNLFQYNGVTPVNSFIVHEDITYYTLDEAGGYTAGYDEGYNVGRADGYGAGYTDGANDANDYTFYSLISSVIDVPVQTFINLLNFDLLGVNMADFGLSLLTVCIIIAVIKLFI